MASQPSFLNILFKGILKKIKGTPAAGEQLSFWTVKYLKHLPQGPLASISWQGGKLWFVKSWELMHSFDEIMGQEIYRFASESDRPLIIDCGANIGLSVLYFAKLYPNARIIAFEPDAQNFSLLQKNKESYGIAYAELQQEAVWIHNDTITFNATGGQGSKIGEGTGTTVQCRRLADLLQQPVDFLKIDIEGAEYPVIKDCAHLLHNVKNLFLEYHGAIAQSTELTDMLNILHNAGFSYYIKEAADNVQHPFLPPTIEGFQQQLNIFAVRG